MTTAPAVQSAPTQPWFRRPWVIGVAVLVAVVVLLSSLSEDEPSAPRAGVSSDHVADDLAAPALLVDVEPAGGTSTAARLDAIDGYLAFLAVATDASFEVAALADDGDFLGLVDSCQRNAVFVAGYEEEVRALSILDVELHEHTLSGFRNFVRGLSLCGQGDLEGATSSLTDANRDIERANARMDELNRSWGGVG
jgi:hypothetical protein